MIRSKIDVANCCVMLEGERSNKEYYIRMCCASPFSNILKSLQHLKSWQQTGDVKVVDWKLDSFWILDGVGVRSEANFKVNKRSPKRQTAVRWFDLRFRQIWAWKGVITSPPPHSFISAGKWPLTAKGRWRVVFNMEITSLLTWYRNGQLISFD